MKRPGYYVESRFFGDHYHQAVARAKRLADEYGRTIDITFLAHEDYNTPNNAVPYSVTSINPSLRNAA